MNKTTIIVLAAACFAIPAGAAQWSAIRSDDSAKLSVDTASIARKGGEVSLKYMVDFAKTQGDDLRKVSYRSIVTTATLRCKPRTLSLGTSELYSEPDAKGVLVARAVPGRRERGFAAIEKGTSDEDLWRHVCEKARAKKSAGS